MPEVYRLFSNVIVHPRSPHDALHVLCCATDLSTCLGQFLSEEKFVRISLSLAVDGNVDELLEKISGRFEQCVHVAKSLWVCDRRWFSGLRSSIEVIGEQPVESGPPFRQGIVIYFPFREKTRRRHFQNAVEA